jgi:hypothetical protein
MRDPESMPGSPSKTGEFKSYRMSVDTLGRSRAQTYQKMSTVEKFQMIEQAEEKLNQLLEKERAEGIYNCNTLI